MKSRMTRPIPVLSPYMIDLPGKERPAVPLRRRPIGITLPGFCLAFAAPAALGGMVLGIVMGIRQDFTLAPAHAHLNLLGWVTMAIYGLFHRATGRLGGWLGWLQAGAGALGALLMGGGLALYLVDHDDRLFPVVVAGSLASLTGMALFLLLVLTSQRPD